MHQSHQIKTTKTAHYSTLGEVGKHVPGIGYVSGCMIGEVPGDFQTQVKVDAKNQTARDVLTGCVPLKDYSAILWDAKTWEKEDGQYRTIIRYQGRRHLPPKK